MQDRRLWCHESQIRIRQKIIGMTDQTLTLSSTIEIQMVGMSLLDYLCKRFPYKNESAWFESITTGKVVVNGKTTTPDQLLQHKDTVSYTSIRNEPPVATNIQTIFEDDHILVVNKPAPLPVHADGFFILNTLIYMLRERTGNSELRLGHRLDRETTGILILGKNQLVISKLVNEFENSNVEKWYLTIVKGEVDFTEKTIRGWIGPKPGGKVSQRQHLIEQPQPGYKESTSYFILRQKLNGHSLLACQLLTGRTNQIRTHLESIGHSVVGDKLYGQTDDDYFQYVKDFKQTRDLNTGYRDHPRQLLHAWKLSINHPVTGERLQWEAPIPQDMQGFIDQYK